MSIEQNKQIARRFVEEVWNGGDIAVADDLLAPDFVNHDADPSRTIDREGFKRFVTSLRAAVPDLRFAVEDMIAEGEKVATRVSAAGTGGGQPVAWTGIGIIRVAGGKIAEQWADSEAIRGATGSAPGLQPG